MVAGVFCKFKYLKLGSRALRFQAAKPRDWFPQVCGMAQKSLLPALTGWFRAPLSKCTFLTHQIQKKKAAWVLFTHFLQPSLNQVIVWLDFCFLKNISSILYFFFPVPLGSGVLVRGLPVPAKLCANLVVLTHVQKVTFKKKKKKPNTGDFLNWAIPNNLFRSLTAAEKDG